MQVTGIGQCAFDLLGIIDSYPEPDTKKEVLSWDEQGGGPVATALVALSRLGVQCKFYGVIGDDYGGERIRESLMSEGIDVSGLVRREGASSQMAFIAIEKGSGRRTIFWRRPTGEELKPEELDEDFLAGADFLLIDGLMARVSLYAAKKAREMGLPVMLDAGRLHEGILEVAKNCDYVVASEEFIKDLGWEDDPFKLQKEVRSLGARVVTITFGERGSITFIDDEIIETPAFRVRTVDTTGAGDVFHGGYIFGLLKGWDIRDVLTFASAMAAIKCEKIGGRKGIPDLEGVMRFLKERGQNNHPE